MEVVILDTEALEFFNNIKLCFYDGDISINLMDKLPFLKSGIVGISTMGQLLEAYMEFNELDYQEPLQKLLRTKIRKSQDIDFILLIEDRFKHEYKPNIDINNLRLEMFAITFIYKFSTTFRVNNFDIYEIMKELAYNQKDEFLKLVLPIVNQLCLCVLFDEHHIIVNRLLTMNPMYNKCKAYKLAIERGDNNIIISIRNNIILRILLHKEVLTKFIGMFSKDIYRILVDVF